MAWLPRKPLHSHTGERKVSSSKRRALQALQALAHLGGRHLHVASPGNSLPGPWVMLPEAQGCKGLPHFVHCTSTAFKCRVLQ
jgi:hypothetical protein